MSAGNTAKILRGAGRMAIDYTDGDFTGTFPFGGTQLGYSIDVTLRKHSDTFSILAEEFGGVPVEVLEGGEFWLVGCFLRAWNPDAVTTIFPNTRTGAKTARPVVQLAHSLSGGRRAGQRISDRKVKLAFAPDDPDRVDGWVAYRALPMLEISRALAFDREEEVGVPAIFACLPDTSANLLVGEHGPLVDLTA